MTRRATVTTTFGPVLVHNQSGPTGSSTGGLARSVASGVSISRRLVIATQTKTRRPTSIAANSGALVGAGRSVSS